MWKIVKFKDITVFGQFVLMESGLVISQDQQGLLLRESLLTKSSIQWRIVVKLPDNGEFWFRQPLNNAENVQFEVVNAVKLLPNSAGKHSCFRFSAGEPFIALAN